MATTNGKHIEEEGLSLSDLPKSNVFTSNLPADSKFPTPADSWNASRKELGPRMVKGALYTFVKPEARNDAELYAVSPRAMKDIGLKVGEEEKDEFEKIVSGNKILWDPETDKGIYPWAQCYGGWQFGSWAGQLGDGRAISLFESTNPSTGQRYEIQLKGAGITPYSRFADGKAVVRSSVREFVVSEALNGLGIPATRALSLTLCRDTKVARERIESAAVVCRFAQSWIRIGTFDILRARGDRVNLRRLADYVAMNVYSGWDNLPSHPLGNPPESFESDKEAPTLEEPLHLNRYAKLYRHIALQNAKTVAAWQAYGFTNGVLNTDNTSILGLSLDFGPFAFIDNFDPNFTPNHDDHMLRYSYRNQPSVIWWNLVRLGENMGELIGSGSRVDEEEFVNKGVASSWAPELIARAERLIASIGSEYQATFLSEYKKLMTARLGLKKCEDSDFSELYSSLLNTLEALELDFSHFFRRLSTVSLSEIDTKEKRSDKASIFFHEEDISVAGETKESGKEKIAAWLGSWRERVLEDWASGQSDDLAYDKERQAAMKKSNPKFVARGWVLDEVIQKVEHQHDKDVLKRIMRMASDPFRDSWGETEEERREEERWCGEVPRLGRGMMCSCSS